VRRGPQKSEAIPLFSQSPYRVGSGPFGPRTSLGKDFALAAAAKRRASASTSARSAAGESGFRCDAGRCEDREISSVIEYIPGRNDCALFNCQASLESKPSASQR
jgi:hypothetical protein